MHKMAFLALAPFVLSFAAVGCAPPSPAEEEAGSTASAAIESDAELAANTLYLATKRFPSGMQPVHVLDRGPQTTDTIVLCKKEMLEMDRGQELWNEAARRVGKGDQVVVVHKEDVADDSPYAFQTLKTTEPFLDPQNDNCGEIKQNGSSRPAYVFEIIRAPVEGSLLRKLPLQDTLTKEFAKKLGSYECSGSLSVGDVSINPTFRSFKFEAGELLKPDVDVEIEGTLTTAASGKCSASVKRSLVLMAGFVPVYVELSAKLSIGLVASVSGPIRISTDGSSFPRTGTATLTPELEVGIKVYKVVGAKVSLKLPVTVADESDASQICTPKVTAGVSIELTGEAGYGPFSISRGVEVSTTRTLRESSCTARDTGPAAPPCMCTDGEGRDGEKLAPAQCGTQVCGKDANIWTCEGGNYVPTFKSCDAANGAE